MIDSLPKVLIISRGVWDDSKGTSSTLSNLFEDYDSEKLAHLYIETIPPNTKCCHRFFQISEFALVHKLFKWWTKTGHEINTQIGLGLEQNERIASQEASAMGLVRRHRSFWFSLAREILWGFNGWKSKELKDFVKSFDPDVVWMDGSPLPLMNRLYDFVLKVAKKPAVIFMQDDVYTYKSCSEKWTSRLYRWYLRKTVKRVVLHCNDMFVASPKMKQEYDEIFGFISTFIAKSVDTNRVLRYDDNFINNPVRMVYMGQVIYGRIYSLIDIAEALSDINNDGTKLQLYIYTNNEISEKEKHRLLCGGNVFLEPPVPYTEVPNIIKNNDVVVFVESFAPQFCKVARLSFSTKICDYLASNKCIFAVGPSDIAPIEYFGEEDAAIVANNKDEIKNKLQLISDQKTVLEYRHKAQRCLKKNHERKKMDEVIYGKLAEIAKMEYRNR